MAGMKDERPSRLEDHLGYWLRCLSNLVSDSFAGRLEAHGVSVPQWVVLRCLFDMEGAPLGDLARDVGVDNGALSRMVERLVQKGLVSREADPSDRRAVRLRLTDAGRKLVPVLAREADRNDAEFFCVIDADERARLLATVKALLEKNDWRGRAME
jgi:DNA-binding MarR family transcriptional regulator